MSYRPSLLILLVVAVGCSTRGTTPPVLSGESDVTREVLPGLEQRVTLTPAELIVGENVTIGSVITNRGNQPLDLESRTCGLNLGGDLGVAWPEGSGRCTGYSIGGSIAPGKSRGGGDIQQVTSRPGIYTLRVQHAVRPEVWVEMRVAVRAR